MTVIDIGIMMHAGSITWIQHCCLFGVYGCFSFLMSLSILYIYI